jgi:hypothetical protein
MSKRKKSVTRQRSGGRKRTPQEKSIPLHIDYDRVRKELKKLPDDSQSMEIYKLMDQIDKGKKEYDLGQTEWSTDPNVKVFAKKDVESYWKWYNSSRNSTLRRRIEALYTEMEKLRSHRDTGETEAAKTKRHQKYWRKVLEYRKLRAEAASRFVDTRVPYWSDRRLVWFCEQLTDENSHAESGYISGVHLGKIPHDIYWDAERKKLGQYTLGEW